MADDVRTTSLPGIGEQHELTTTDGEHVAVVQHRDGDRELVVFSREDPDACRVALRLNGEDARRLAALLGDAPV